MVLAVVDERALRSERIDGGTGRATALSTSGVGRRVGECAIFVLRIDGDRVAVRVVGLDENGVMAAVALVGVRQHRGSTQQRGRHGRDDGRQSNQISHFSSSGQWFEYVREARG